MRRRLGLAAVVLAVGLAASGAGAADEGLVLRQSAERLAAAGRCDEAIGKAQRARALAPEDAEAAALEGRCALQLKRYDEAVAPLETARRLDPAMPGLSADLAMAHYHRGDLQAMERALERAETESPDDPRVSLYRGLLHLERSEDERAAAALERAARMDPAIDPLASYYAALAWERARERRKAREALEGVRDRSPSSPWAAEARRALERLDAAADLGGRWWATLSAGLEWDDNVVLRGDGVTLPSDISDERDWRGFWSAEVGSELLRTENFAAGAIAGYDGSAHFDLHAFDLQYPSASVWLDRRIDDASFLRLQPFFGYAWTETDPYLLHAGAELSYHRDFDDAGAGRLHARYGYRNYLFNAAGSGDLAHERDRDGDVYRAGYEHEIAVAAGTMLRGGLVYQHYDAEGSEYTHDLFGGHVGVRQALPARFTLDAEGAYSHEPYRRASTFPTPGANSAKRRDDVWSVRVLLERPLTDWLSVAAHWRYVDNDSNTQVFDYDRHIVGGYFTLSYGP